MPTKKDILESLEVIRNHKCFEKLCINNQENIKEIIKELKSKEIK